MRINVKMEGIRLSGSSKSVQAFLKKQKEPSIERDNGDGDKTRKRNDKKRKTNEVTTRRFPVVPKKLRSDSIVPRVDGSFSVRLSRLGEDVAMEIEEMCGIKPKDMSHMFGGKPPPPYPTTFRDLDEKGKVRLHIKPPLGHYLWGSGAKSSRDMLGCTKLPKPLKFNGELCDGSDGTPLQAQAVDAVIKYLDKMKNTGAAACMLVAPTGTGKTVMALNVASRLSLLTFVLVHRKPLLVQWEARIKHFLPDARVGFARESEFDIFDKDIVIVMIDSLLSRAETPEEWRRGETVTEDEWNAAIAKRTKRSNTKKLPPGIKKWPAFLLRKVGLVIVDEAHHLGAKTYSHSLDLLPVQNKLCITATPERGGRLVKQLFWICGPVVAEFERVWQMVHVKTIVYENPSTQKILRRGDMVAVWDMNKGMVYDFDRNEIIIKEALDAIETGRHVIIFVERTRHVNFLYRKLMGFKEKYNPLPSGFKSQLAGMYIPQLPEEERQRNLATSCIVITTYAYSREGIDEPTLDTLIFGSPVSQLKQVAGRILRPCKHKQTPLFIDIVEDYYEMYAGMANVRSRYYEAEDWIIERHRHVVREANTGDKYKIDRLLMDSIDIDDEDEEESF